MVGELRFQSTAALLIEPVWNRNETLIHVVPPPNILLIEPVWNRNLGQHTDGTATPPTFNRTSLESKLAHL